MIEFDSFDFEWQVFQPSGEKKLLITVRGIDNWPQPQREYFETQLKITIKDILNAGA